MVYYTVYSKNKYYKKSIFGKKALGHPRGVPLLSKTIELFIICISTQILKKYVNR